MQTLDLADLVNVWSGELYNAMVFATGTTPPAHDAAITPIPPPDLHGGGFEWRNLAYALQWWVFAGFAVFMWWRMVRDDHETTVALREHDARGDGPAQARDEDVPAETPAPTCSGAPRATATITTSTPITTSGDDDR